jgi:hypothetical protein
LRFGNRRDFAGALAGQEARLAALIAAPLEATLAELRNKLLTSAALSTLWRAVDRLTVEKSYKPTNSDILTLSWRGVNGTRGCLCAMCARTVPLRQFFGRVHEPTRPATQSHSTNRWELTANRSECRANPHHALELTYPA